MAQVEKLKIGNTSYGITDANTLPALNATTRAQLLSYGTYLSSSVEDGKVFESDTGKFEKFSKTVSGSTLGTFYATSMPSLAYWSSVAYGNGKYVAVATEYSNKAAYSTNGSSWTAATLPASTCWSFVTYGNGKFVAVAKESKTAAYSTDGITWTSSTLPYSLYWTCVIYGDNKFVAIAEQTDKAAYSTDGINWTAMTMPSSSPWYRVAYGNGRYVAITGGSYTYDKAAYSTDGINWTQTSMPSTKTWSGFAYGNGRFVVSARTSSDAAYSTDGVTWTTMTMPLSGWQYMAYGDMKFVAMDSSRTQIAYSSDGLTWSTKAFPSLLYWYGITYGNGRFVAVGGHSNAGKAAYASVTASYTYSLTDLSSYTAGTGLKMSGPKEISVCQVDGDVPWTQPVVTAPGTMGVSDMAVTQSGYYEVSGYDCRAYGCFNPNGDGYTGNSNHWQYNSVSTSVYHHIAWYTKDAVKITSMLMHNSEGAYSILDYIFEGSNDNSTWTELTTGTNTNTTNFGEYTISCPSNTNYYHYYRIRCKARSTTSIMIGQINITGYTRLEGTVARATTSLYGLVKPDGSSIAVSNGIISASPMTGATSSAAGSAGIVPAPASSDADKFLKGDGTWAAAGSAPTYNATTETLEF